MTSADKLAMRARRIAIALAACAGVALAGCGTPGAPQPPTLNVPQQVNNLTAVRTGDMVALNWTMPRRNTDKMLLKSPMRVQVCRGEGSGACVAAGTELTLAPAASGVFSERLPAELASGLPRPLRYFVEVKNSHGRSAGESNAAVVLAGQAPAPVADLSAEVRKDGIVLRWQPVDAAESIRLERTLENPPSSKASQGPLSVPAEPVNQNLDVASDEGRALDKSIVFGRKYSYCAQRVARMEVDGKTLELAGQVSAPIRIHAEDVFPPVVPQGLAAVANPAANEQPPSIDLSWQPNSETDLAGYFVYRREAETPWQRISGEQPVPAPAFHDANVQPGHTYIYGVAAVDRKGHESSRSADAEEMVPQH